MHVVMLLGNAFRHDARVEKEATALAEDGHTVSVIALYEDPTQRGTVRWHPGVRVVRVFPTSLGVIPRLRRMAGGTAEQDETRTPSVGARTAGSLVDLVSILATGLRRSLMRRAFVRAAVSSRPDALHAHDAETLRAGAIVARRLRLPLVYDAHELIRYDDTQRRPARYAGHLLEKLYAARAAAILTVSGSIAEVFRTRFPSSDVILLRNIPEASSSPPDPDPSLLDPPLPPGPVYLYQGGLTPHRPLQLLIDAVAELPSGNAVFIGPSFEGTDEALRAHAERRLVTHRVRVLGLVPRQELAAVTALADVGVILLDGTSRNQSFALPNKLFEYIQARVPVCAPELPEIAAVVREHQVGSTFAPRDAGDLARALTTAASSTNPAALDAAASRFTWERERSILLGLYRRISAGLHPERG